jgi:alkylation response protein AidB-like acyl-CoA dehydrogenase
MVAVQRALELERVAVSAQLLYAARHAQAIAVAWARHRRQFGTRLLDHQALAHRLADCESELVAAESLLNSVLLLAADNRPISVHAAALKLRAAHLAAAVVDNALQTLGGRGYTQNYPLERILRDVRLARIGAGTDEVLRELIAARLDRPDPQYERLIEELQAADLPLPDDRLDVS